MDNRLLDRLRDALKGRGEVAMSQFSWINLDLVRKEAGEDWAWLKKKVYIVAFDFIEKRLGPKDVVMPFSGGFMVVFGTLEGEAVERRAAQISLELNAFFVGERAFKNVSVHTNAASVSPEQMMSMLSEGAARKKDEPPAARESSLDWENFGGGKRERHYHRDETCEVPKRSSSKFEASQGREEPDSPLSESIKKDRHQRAPHLAIDPSAASRRIGEVWFEPVYKQDDAPWSEVIFRPCWDAKAEVISSNMCLARRSYRGRYFYGRDTLMGRADPVLRRRLDVSVAYAAQRSFLESYRSRKKCALVIPVFYDTLRRAPDRIQYLAALRVIPEGRRRFFSLRVMEIPVDVAPGQVQEVLGAIKAAGFNILVDLPFGRADFNRFEWCNVAVFGSQLPARCGERGFADADLHTLTNQVRGARNMGAQTYLTTVLSANTIPAAMRAGVRYFTGMAIAGETPYPVPLTPLACSAIMSRVPAEQPAL